jgi:hypothetical protein
MGWPWGIGPTFDSLVLRNRKLQNEDWLKMSGRFTTSSG